MNVSRNGEIFQEIKEKNDIVSVVSEYVILKRSGRSLIGLCPFHNEKTPSFNVNQEKQFFYCFGCGTGGDVFSFVMKMENLEFIEAARRLAERAGIQWPDLKQVSDIDEQRKEYFKLNQLAAALYYQYLRNTESGKKARLYLTNRGIMPELWDKFNLGYAPSSWHALTNVIRQKGLSLQQAETLGLIASGENGYYDRFRKRVIFPIADPQGRIVGFGGRVMEQGEPKYLNSPENIIFHKGRFLYGLFSAKDSIRRNNQAIIVEGYMDVIQAHQAGFTQTVASLGTALTKEQAKLIRRFTSEVVLAYDADTAGQNATIRGMEILRNAGLTVRVLNLPGGFDPDSFIREKGKEEFEILIAKAIDLIDFKIKLILEKYDLTTYHGKLSAMKELISCLAIIENNVAREHYIRKIARETGFTENAIQRELEKWLRENSKNTSFSDKNFDTSYTKQVTSVDKSIQIKFDELSPLQKAIFEAEKELLQSSLQEYDKLKRIKNELTAEEFKFEIWRNLFLKIKELDFSTDNIQAVLNEFNSAQREIAVALVAEQEVKNLPTDFEQIISHLRMLHIMEKIEVLTSQITSGRDETGRILSDAEIKQQMVLVTDLNRKLKKEYPRFSGL